MIQEKQATENKRENRRSTPRGKMQSARLIGHRLYRGRLTWVAGGFRRGGRKDKGVSVAAHVRARPEHLLLLAQSRLVWAEGNTPLPDHPRERKRAPGTF